jgi:N utilization substance protein B
LLSRDFIAINKHNVSQNFGQTRVKKSRRGSPFERARMARLASVQAFYQMMQQEQSSEVVIAEFISLRFNGEDYVIQPDPVLFRKLVSSADNRKSEIFDLIKASLNREGQYERLEYVLKAILCIASAELLDHPTNVPAPVIITEYVDITHSFYAGKETSFVNSYLDRLARNLDYPMTRQVITDQAEQS